MLKWRFNLHLLYFSVFYTQKCTRSWCPKYLFAFNRIYSPYAKDILNSNRLMLIHVLSSIKTHTLYLIIWTSWHSHWALNRHVFAHELYESQRTLPYGLGKHSSTSLLVMSFPTPPRPRFQVL